MSVAFHPQTDGQSERTIHVLSLLTTIIICLVYRWHHMRLYMVEGVSHHYVGKPWERSLVGPD